MEFVRRIIAWFLGQLEGRASARIVAVLAAVFALDSADKGAVGAMATQLEHGLGIGKAQLGLFLTVSSGVGAVATLPFGLLADRVKRTRVLTIAILLWGGAMLVSASATSYLYLLFTRLALGAVVAAAVPVVASLVGDYFQPHLRGRMYSYILSGELIGTGFGYIIAGELALLSWRVGFLGLAVPALLIAWLVHRLPEPTRGGADRLKPGQEHFEKRFDQDHDRGDRPEKQEEKDIRGLEQSSPIRDMIRDAGVEPREGLVKHENPRDKSLWWAAWYVLHIPTNLILIIASALGYYFFAGVRTFGVQFMHEWFGLAHSLAIGTVIIVGVGGLAGVLTGGRLGDYLLGRKHLSARVIVATFAYLGTAVFLIPVLLSHLLYIALPFLIVAGSCLGAVNPPLDAARLDIMHPYLWGRAESVRTTLRLTGEAIAPVLFGWLAQSVLGGGPAGLDRTFLVMLVPLFVSGGIGFIAFRTYPRDVATADAYTLRTVEEETEKKEDQDKE